MRSLLALAVLAAPAQLEAQAELQGRVLAEPERRPIANATVTAPGLDIRTVTDSLGRFRLSTIPHGEHVVVTSALGFRPDSTRTAFDGDETLVSDVVLKPAVKELPTVAVREKADTPVRRGKMAAFDERNRKVARAFATCLDAAGIRFAVLGQEESCTGDPARRMGN